MPENDADLSETAIPVPALEDVTAGEAVLAPGVGWGPRIAQELQLVGVHEGEVTLWLDGTPRQARSPLLLLLLPGQEERWQVSLRQTRLTWAHVRFAPLPVALVARLAALPWPLPLSAAMAETLNAAAVLEWSGLSTAPELLATTVMLAFWRAIGEGESAVDQPSSRVLVESARRYMREHVGEPLTLGRIARAVAVSERHLLRVFREELDTTPVATLWDERVRRGTRLLEETALPVGVVASACGFRSAFHFSRRIREATGVPPLELRRRAASGS